MYNGNLYPTISIYIYIYVYIYYHYVLFKSKKYNLLNPKVHEFKILMSVS